MNPTHNCGGFRAATPMRDQHNPAGSQRKSVGWFLLFIIVLTGFIGALVLTAGRVRAISNPTSITIVSSTAYSGVLETDDLLVVVHYNLAYGSFPTEQISDAYVGRFLRGTTELNSVEPFPFNNRGYGVGGFSMYWTAAEKTTDSIEFGDTNSEGYKIIFQGKPGVFPGSTPTTATNPDSPPIVWQSASKTQELLQKGIKLLAYEFERNSAWVTNTYDLISGKAGTEQLTANGEIYFSGVVPNLQVMIPDLFSSAAQTVPIIERTYTKSYAKDLEKIWDGNWVDKRFSNLASQLKMPKEVITSMVAFIICAFIAFVMMGVLHGTPYGLEFGLMTFAVTIPLFTVVAWIPLAVTGLIAFIAVMGIGWAFLGRKAA